MNSTTIPDIELLTLPQAAKLCGVGERTLWRWSRTGVAPAPVKIGPGKQGATRYRRSEYLAWIEARCPRVEARTLNLFEAAREGNGHE